MDKYNEIELQKLRIQKHKTNHILHLLISIITAGLWVPIWFMVSITNSISRNQATNRIKEFLLDEDNTKK